MITLYDFAWKHSPNAGWNSHVWKTRYVLNYKGLEYKTIFIEYPDVEATIKKIGAKPTGTQPNGQPWYTLPAIVDDSTGVALAESADIAEYLDKTYPDTPRAIPEGSHALQAAFRDAYYPKLSAFFPFLVPCMEQVMNPPSAKHFRAEYEAIFGATLEDVFPKGDARVEAWKKWTDTISSIDAWMRPEDEWIMGDKPSFADFIIAGFVLSAKTFFGEDSQEWKDITTINNGRWGRMAKNLEKYSQSK
ncbi:hypothetical protein GYMLUDRAFT_181206 [Collybiopsis luxurians FD-317 M1]|uniref:GST N-terminal domain-containing protein n=1 Tax=Collybiopsis luxurians FD-317 M1 TaxID=944289 RepID=A0A0D0CA01_9AGAR|nr:hypothetical protein GYMLUDRAFT_181206 [Collybiopsis luxurians FD-317 M1]